MTRTFKKNQTKKHLWSETEVYIDSRSIQEDSAIIQTHLVTLNLPQKGKTHGIRDCVQKSRVYMQIFQ